MSEKGLFSYFKSVWDTKTLNFLKNSAAVSNQRTAGFCAFANQFLENQFLDGYSRCTIRVERCNKNALSQHSLVYLNRRLT